MVYLVFRNLISPMKFISVHTYPLMPTTTAPAIYVLYKVHPPPQPHKMTAPTTDSTDYQLAFFTPGILPSRALSRKGY